MKSWPIEELDVIGYSSVLESEVLPRVLPLVFQVRAAPDHILIPPFHRVAGAVIDPIIVTLEEFNELVTQNKATRMDSNIGGRANHELWVDAEGCLSYEPLHSVKTKFATIFQKRLAWANQSLDAGRYDAAARHAAVARAVNPSNLEPLIITGSCELLSGNFDILLFTRHLAQRYMAEPEFDLLVHDRAFKASSSTGERQCVAFWRGQWNELGPGSAAIVLSGLLLLPGQEEEAFRWLADTPWEQSDAGREAVLKVFSDFLPRMKRSGTIWRGYRDWVWTHLDYHLTTEKRQTLEAIFPREYSEFISIGISKSPEILSQAIRWQFEGKGRYQIISSHHVIRTDQREAFIEMMSVFVPNIPASTLTTPSSTPLETLMGDAMLVARLKV